ncbi:MAG: GDP-mannose 4,6-dehydratase [Candidatus Bathyarchaeota archaeon]|nr:MAG: GDP-mannose 4,6-dehydratase [Candidatus Bathyarchaeota archaeon]
MYSLNLSGKPMNISVTGGAGYIGSLLVKKLVEDGHEVVSIDNLTNGDYGNLRSLGIHKKAELLVGDIRDAKFIEDVITGSDAIVHLAAIPGLVKCKERPEEATSTNVYGTYRVLEAARKLDIGKVVFCSSAAVYGTPVEMPVTERHSLRPMNLYGVTKLAGEKLMEIYHENYEIETMSLRFGNVFGVGLFTNFDTVIPKFVRMGLNEDDLTVYGDGTSSRDFVHVEDIAQAVVLSLRSSDKGGEVFNVGGETMEIGALAELVAESVRSATGRRIGITHLPPRPGEAKEFSYDLEKIKELLGYRSRWSIEHGVAQILEYTRTHLNP